MGTALTPRVRMMAICDRVRESNIEGGVFDLKGVRQAIAGADFPFTPGRLWLFFVLSSPCPGVFPGYIRVVHDQTERVVYHAYLRPRPSFRVDDDVCTGRVPLRCRFPEAGRFTVQLWFFQEQGYDVLKGETPFFIHAEDR